MRTAASSPTAIHTSSRSISAPTERPRSLDARRAWRLRATSRRRRATELTSSRARAQCRRRHATTSRPAPSLSPAIRGASPWRGTLVRGHARRKPRSARRASHRRRGRCPVRTMQSVMRSAESVSPVATLATPARPTRGAGRCSTATTPPTRPSRVSASLEEMPAMLAATRARATTCSSSRVKEHARRRTCPRHNAARRTSCLARATATASSTAAAAACATRRRGMVKSAVTVLAISGRPEISHA